MACYHPITAYYDSFVGATGKRGVVFQKPGSFSGVPLKLPCGQCVGCKLERSRQWAMRCMHEARLWPDNCFVTLTYSKEHLPPFGDLCLRDLQLFLKRLRKSREPNRFRYYACGEYGDLNMRPHYHAILFNVDFSDKRVVGQNRRGDNYYQSKELGALWPLGISTLGSVSFDSAAYVARYCLKKISGRDADDHYSVMDGDGVVHVRPREFTVMSRRGGIGSGWFEKYGKETYTHDNVVVNGRLVRPPRFYDLKQELTDPDGFVKLQKTRRKKMRLFRSDQTPDRRRVREVIALRKLQLLKRGV